MAVVYTLDTKDGASVSFCSLDHVKDYTDGCAAYGLDVGFLISGSETDVSYCLHCGLCGRLLETPMFCLVHTPHGELCAELDLFSATFTALNLYRVGMHSEKHWQAAADAYAKGETALPLLLYHAWTDDE